MLDAAETLEEIANLFAQLPGVEILGYDLSDSVAMLHLRIRGADAIQAVQRLSISANVDPEPFVKTSESGVELEQALIAKLQSVETLELGNLQMLGIHVIWHLHRSGLAATREANEYLTKWRGQLV